jgi:beta-phosphoglucomutase-like phosphatase (HAD superfamily)
MLFQIQKKAETAQAEFDKAYKALQEALKQFVVANKAATAAEKHGELAQESLEKETLIAHEQAAKSQEQIAKKAEEAVNTELEKLQGAKGAIANLKTEADKLVSLTPVAGN